MVTEKRLIDAKALWEYVKTTHISAATRTTIMCLLDIAPTVDAVEVVRCKDCYHYRESEHPERTGIKFCYRLKDRNGERVGYNYSDNDFCSHGERRKDA